MRDKESATPNPDWDKWQRNEKSFRCQTPLWTIKLFKISAKYSYNFFSFLKIKFKKFGAESLSGERPFKMLINY